MLNSKAVTLTVSHLYQRKANRIQVAKTRMEKEAKREKEFKENWITTKIKLTALFRL
jgi:hypothetical protein